VSGRRTFAVPAAVGLAGLAAAVLAAAGGGIPAGDATHLLVNSAIGAGVAGGVAAGLLRLLRRSRIGVQAAVAALAPVLAVAIGVVWAASSMFIMHHDLAILWVVLAGAGTVSVLVSLGLDRQVSAAARSVEDMARRLGEAGPGSALRPDGPAAGRGEPEQLARLAAQLEETSARLAEAREQAAAVERSRRELVAWVSHDLRTPLAGIRAMVEALEDGVVTDAPTVARYYATMRRETDRLAGLVNDLFELSRIQAGSLALDLEQVPLDELVGDALAGAAVAAAAKNIDLRGEVSEPPPVVELSTPEMTRVVRNLLDNAIRHTPPGGVVAITAGLDPSGTAVEVSVQDACGGIPDDELDLVFEMAYRGDAARTPGGAGAGDVGGGDAAGLAGSGGGLGLAVARGLVEAHHGEIRVRNAEPGCCFTVTLPLQRS